ncbi:hypothetical protein GCM10012285_12920 [Streptomyces kronopolitis]|uniref:Uncharacterized protein n=1 Tax=Streptomyces kronopolitis TaxID=1612435 RepID=A0ABQ2J512_9ACTN|nr:hypothetical protein GCM10012285_12920 [Streptomyces kronopolitis]
MFALPSSISLRASGPVGSGWVKGLRMKVPGRMSPNSVASSSGRKPAAEHKGVPVPPGWPKTAVRDLHPEPPGTFGSGTERAEARVRE